MNKIVKCALTGLILSTPAFASDFEYSGYMRTGIGFSEGGTDQVCFNLDKPSGKDRLGNECETYIETAFMKRHRLGEDENAPSFSTNLRLAFVSNGDRDWEATGDNNLNISLREAFVKSENLFSKGGMDIWAGKRFYRRHDIHLLDFYYLANSGPGAGVENINLGFGKAHVAVIRNVPSINNNSITEAKLEQGLKRDLGEITDAKYDAEIKKIDAKKDGPVQTNFDFRLTDIKAGNGNLGLAYIHSGSSTKGYESGQEKWEPLSGDSMTAMYQMDAMGGFNKTILQYGKGLLGASGHSSKIDGGGDYVAKGSNTDAIKKSSTLRVINQLVTEFDKQASMSVVALYSSVDSGGVKDANGKELPKLNELLLAVRPSYYLSNNAALTFSYSINKIENYAQDAKGEWIDGSMQKFTFAPEISIAPGYWSRPKLRLFATYASWNEDLKNMVAKGTTYSDDTSGFSTGAQLEVWW